MRKVKREQLTVEVLRIFVYPRIAAAHNIGDMKATLLSDCFTKRSAHDIDKTLTLEFAGHRVLRVVIASDCANIDRHYEEEA